MTTTRVWFETTLSMYEAHDFAKKAFKHFYGDATEGSFNRRLITRYFNEISLEIVPPAGSTFCPRLGERAYPLHVVGLRGHEVVNGCFTRSRAAKDSLEDVPCTDRRVTRRIIVKPMAYAHTNPIPLEKRYA